MTRRVGAKKKISRSLGVNLWGRSNDSYAKRNYRPGQHGTAVKRETTYGLQLRAKQKLKKYYANINEVQFKNLFLKAKRSKKDTAQAFVGLLESRLDTVIYRANFVPTMFSARQVVNHRHVKVNGKMVGIASFLLRPGDSVEVRDKSRKVALIVDSLAKAEREVPSYLTLDTGNFSVKYNAVPALEDIPYPIVMDVNLVVEFYSR
ncbi:MAG: 30S ribosomal protein S4 [Rickettsiales bacterium]|jgi:small subunit ribosomal protein S4|nr:30S ribosomal protein S4 [Rickettsiales bacterium]